MPSKSTILLSLLAIVFFAAAFSIRWNSHRGEVKVKINETVIRADIAGTPEARAKGLGGRSSLRENEGMLFLFPEKGQHTFWMKDMLFPIDIIWIVDGKVADLTFEVPVAKNDDLPLYAPWVPVDRVLEVPAGFAGRHRISIGDPVEIPVDKNIQIQ